MKTNHLDIAAVCDCCEECLRSGSLDKYPICRLHTAGRYLS